MFYVVFFFQLFIIVIWVQDVLFQKYSEDEPGDTGALTLIQRGLGIKPKEEDRTWVEMAIPIAFHYRGIKKFLLTIILISTLVSI